MPKSSVITKENIVEAAFEIVRTEGFSALSARNVAKKIGCSTQPIYWMYDCMEALRQDVITKILQFLQTQISSWRKTGKPFLDLGLGYVRVAFMEPVLFKAIYMENVMQIKLTDLIPDDMMLSTIQNDSDASEIPAEKLNDAAINSWIFAHGLASLIAAGIMEYNEEKIENLLLFCKF